MWQNRSYYFSNLKWNKFTHSFPSIEHCKGEGTLAGTDPVSRYCFPRVAAIVTVSQCLIRVTKSVGHKTWGIPSYLMWYERRIISAGLPFFSILIWCKTELYTDCMCTRILRKKERSWGHFEFCVFSMLCCGQQ